MDTEDNEVGKWDASNFASAVEEAREKAEATAYVIVSARKLADWESHRPGIELIYYLTLVDYETKVLIHRLLESPNDRYVWEKYLALHLHEVLEQVPKAVSNAIREMDRPGTASKADPKLYKAASKQLGINLRLIRRDTDFMKALRTIRNTVAAHHADSKNSSMESSIAWMLTSATQRDMGSTPMTSQILEHAVHAAWCFQDFAYAVVGVQKAA